MKGAVVMLMLLGCDCDGVACEYVRTISTDWASIESCEASAGSQAAASQTESYPLVIAQCVVDGSSAAPAEIAAEGHAGVPDNAEAATHGLEAAHGGAGWIMPASDVRELVAFGAAYSIRAVGSGLNTYAGQPIRSIASRVLGGLRS